MLRQDVCVKFPKALLKDDWLPYWLNVFESFAVHKAMHISFSNKLVAVGSIWLYLPESKQNLRIGDNPDGIANFK